MPKSANRQESPAEEKVLKIPEQALAECRDDCEKTKTRIFDQIGSQLEKMKETETKVATGIANELRSLSPDTYTSTPDITADEAKEIFKRNSEGFGVAKIDTEKAKQVFATLSDQIEQDFLAQNFGSAQEAMNKANELSERATQLLGFLEAGLQETQEIRGTALRRATEHLVEDTAVPYRKFSRQMQDNDFYNSSIYSLYRRSNTFAGNTADAARQLKKQEDLNLDDIFGQRMTLINNVLMPYVGIHVYYENEAKNEAEVTPQPKAKKVKAKKISG